MKDEWRRKVRVVRLRLYHLSSVTGVEEFVILLSVAERHPGVNQHNHGGHIRHHRGRHHEVHLREQKKKKVIYDRQIKTPTQNGTKMFS